MKLCPHCANPMERGHKFCRHCGAKLKKFVLNRIYITILVVFSLTAALAWYLSYPLFKGSSEEKGREPSAGQTQAALEREPPELEPTQVFKSDPVDQVDQQVTKPPPLENTEEKPSGKAQPRVIEAQVKPRPRQEDRTQQIIPAVVAGTYEVIQPTKVYSQPREDSPQVATIGTGTRVQVVDGSGNWLEIRSKHGRPSGFIKKESAVPRTDFASLEPSSSPPPQEPVPTPERRTSPEVGDLSWINRINIQNQEGRVLLVWNAGEPHVIGFSGQTLLEVPGAYSNEFTGWRTDVVFRANHLYEALVPTLVHSLLERLDGPVPFSGFRNRILANTIPSLSEWEQEFMGNKMQRWGWEAKRARRVLETFDFIIRLEDARKFKHALLSRSELKGVTLAMVNEREKIWGPSR